MNDVLEGIVISSRDYREHDAILQIICKEAGKQSLVARGLRKLQSKNAASTQLFTHARFYVNYREQATMHSMQTADIIDSYRSIREDLLKQAIASVFCECMEKIAIDDPEYIFSILKQNLDILAQSKQPYAIAGLFLSLMNRMNGIEPYVDGCVICNRQDGIMATSLLDGGFICQHCYQPAQHKQMNKQDLMYFRMLCKAELEQYEILAKFDQWTYEHMKMEYDYFAEYSGIHLKSIRFLSCIQDM